ncbi:MAG: TIGR03663 family protein [Acidobacteriota bacterium]|nr:MAG: TIGR03663 family protein [Acidobacteriota bacterium]
MTENRLLPVVFIAVVLLAAWLRLSQIEIKPFHHDEGVNAHFLLNLSRHGQYRYDPTNYHGPTLYYFSLVAVRLFGETDLALRLWPALAGILTILLIWPLRDHLGAAGTVVAALGLAVSPGLVCFSRDFIHETSFGLFSLGMVVGAVRYAERRDFRWMLLLATSAGLLFATKETALITTGVLIIALLTATLWDAGRRLIRKEECFNPRGLAAYLLPSLDHALAGIVILVFINILFYSSMLTHWQGVTDAIDSVLLWSKRTRTEHVKEFWYYFGVLFKLELPLLAGSLLAGPLIIRKGSRFGLFAGAWTLGMTLAYSIIGYKTPWLAVNFLIPMALVTGYGADRICRLLGFRALRAIWILLIALSLGLSLYLSRKVNFERYDDNANRTGYFERWAGKWKIPPYVDGQYGYVYAQTDRELLQLVSDIEKETARFPTGKETGIYIASPDYWPLPWYLRDYPHVAYTGGFNRPEGGPPAIVQSIIIANVNQRPVLDELAGFRLKERVYTLRPGVTLLLATRE